MSNLTEIKKQIAQLTALVEAAEPKVKEPTWKEKKAAAEDAKHERLARFRKAIFANRNEKIKETFTAAGWAQGYHNTTTGQRHWGSPAKKGVKILTQDGRFCARKGDVEIQPWTNDDVLESFIKNLK